MKSPYDFYISPEEYKIAESNGICKKTLEYRIRSSGWDKQRAITDPIQYKGEEWISVKEIALKNGISRATFTQRRKRGWELVESYTIPPLTREEALRRATNSSKRRRVFTDEELKLADNIGIKRSTLYHRYNALKWTKSRSLTRGTLTRSECGKAGALSYMYQTRNLPASCLSKALQTI
ncbi:hypothetical protein [Bacillus cereus]|uniref:hypothetical protein n=1 Tax=Bacillus cereus TaxID=1396 RepID=UPI000BFDAD79|nr:hypothetical protein [Bacillus cereus]MED1835390.1 hypothetical protein [Bacillus thuringiensis]PGO75749.1 hypothetical protein CN985_04905 [Bacillus cereus]